MKGNNLFIIAGICVLFYAVFSCQKTSTSLSSSTTDSTSAAFIAAAASAVQAIAVGSSASSASASDSIYVIHICSSHDKLDSIAFSSLPQTALAYLDSAYAGFTALKAFAIADSTGTTIGYVAIIEYNGKPVGVKFDASGNFIKILEQKLGKELHSCVSDNSSDSTQYIGTHPYDSSYQHGRHPHDSTGRDTSRNH